VITRNQLLTPWLIALGIIVVCLSSSAQGTTPPVSAQPIASSNRASHKPNRAPVLIVFDVNKSIFYYSNSLTGSLQPVPSNFYVDPYTLIYFRARDFNAATTKVTISYQGTANPGVTLPSVISALTQPPSTKQPAQTTPGAHAVGPNDPLTTLNRAEAGLQALSELNNTLADAVNGYNRNVSNPADVKSVIKAVQSSAASAMKDAWVNLKTAMILDAANPNLGPLRLLTSDLDLTDTDLTGPESGANKIEVIGEALREAALDSIATLQKSKELTDPNAEVSKINNLRALYRSAEGTWRVIMNATFFERTEGPEEADDSVDNMIWTVNVSSATDTNAAATSYKLTVRKRDRRNLEFAVSSGVFGSVLRDPSYYVANHVVRQNVSDKFSVSTGALLHVIVTPDGPVRGALSFGLTFDSARYLAGLSLIGGRRQRIVFTAGVIAGKVTRLNGVGVGQPFAGDTPPTQQVYRSAPFIGLSFNF